jgi:hypothetical protein
MQDVVKFPDLIALYKLRNEMQTHQPSISLYPTIDWFYELRKPPFAMTVSVGP